MADQSDAARWHGDGQPDVQITHEWRAVFRNLPTTGPQLVWCVFNTNEDVGQALLSCHATCGGALEEIDRLEAIEVGPFVYDYFELKP